MQATAQVIVTINIIVSPGNFFIQRSMELASLPVYQALQTDCKLITFYFTFVQKVHFYYLFYSQQSLLPIITCDCNIAIMLSLSQPLATAGYCCSSYPKPDVMAPGPCNSPHPGSSRNLQKSRQGHIPFPDTI